jgi:hypothetical protein
VLTVGGGLVAAWCLFASFFYAIDSGGQVARLMLRGLIALALGLAALRWARTA